MVRQCMGLSRLYTPPLEEAGHSFPRLRASFELPRGEAESFCGLILEECHQASLLAPRIKLNLIEAKFLHANRIRLRV
jgi:hypothetical protein